MPSPNARRAQPYDEPASGKRVMSCMNVIATSSSTIVVPISAAIVSAPAAATITPSVVASENAGPIDADARTERSKRERTLRSCGRVQLDQARTQIQQRDRALVLVRPDVVGALAEECDQSRFDDVGSE